ncbi:MAG: acyltransferase, partial [Anaerolineae bacterium]
AVMGAGGGIRIGDNALIGESVNLHAEQHVCADATRPIREQGVRYAEIVIDDDVWIGSRATILAGVTIGKGAVVGAGAVVTHSVGPLAIVAGIPARVVGQRGETAR